MADGMGLSVTATCKNGVPVNVRLRTQVPEVHGWMKANER